MLRANIRVIRSPAWQVQVMSTTMAKEGAS